MYVFSMFVLIKKTLLSLSLNGVVRKLLNVLNFELALRYRMKSLLNMPITTCLSMQACV